MSSTRKIGTAYSSDKQSELGIKCIQVEDSNIAFTGGPESILKFDGVSSYTEMARTLSVDLSVHAKINLGFTSVDEYASISYTNYVKETEYSKSFIFNINAILPSMRLVMSSYGTQALTAYASGLYQGDIEKFREVCGDQFILQESLGASLYISTKLTFITRTEKNTFSINSGWILEGIMDLFKLTPTGIKSVFEDQRISLSVAVLQKGGDLNILNRTFPQLKFQPGGIGVFDCIKNGENAQEDLAKCKSIMADLLDYAANVFPNTVDKNNFESSQTLSTFKMNYATIGVDPGSFAPTEEVKRIRSHLKELYNNLTAQQEFLGKLLQPLPYDLRYMNINGVQVGWNYTSISSPILNKLTALNQTITESVQTIKSLDDICYGSPVRCADFSSSIDFSILESFQAAYTVKSRCNSTIYGPRYMLPIDKNLFKEDSLFNMPNNATINLLVNYKVVPGESSISISINDLPACNGITIYRDTRYSVIDSYMGTFSGECAKMLCPQEVVGVVPTEFILVQTPI